MNKSFKLSLVFLMLLIVSSFAFADFTTDNQLWASLQDGNVSSFDVYGGVTGAEGVVGGAFDFLGTDEYISIGNPMNGANVWEVNALVKWDDVTNNRVILGNNPDSSFSGELQIDAFNGYLRTYIRPTGFVTQTDYSLSIDTWYNITVNSTGTNVYVYVNGTLVNSLANTQAINSQNMFIGRRSPTTGYMDGLIDEVNIEVSGSEVFYASFDSLYDQSNNSNDWQMYNGYTYEESLDAYDSEGTDDYGATNSIFPSTDSDFTMACWVNSDETTRGDYFGQSGFAKLSVGLTTNYYGAVINFDSDGIVLQSTTTIDTNNFIHTALTYDKDTKTGKLFIDGTEEDSYTSTGNKNTNSHVQFIGAEVESVGGSIFNPYDGALSGCVVYNDTKTPTEVAQLYAEGRDYSPYDQPTGEDSTESTATVKQAGSVSFVNPTVIESSTFQVPINNTPMYGGYSFEVTTNNDNDMYCELEIDGISVANKTRSNIQGETGNVFLQSPLLYLSNETNHTQELICERLGGLGLTTISKAIGVGHFLVDNNDNILAHNQTEFNTNINTGSSYGLIDSFSINTSNQTPVDQVHNIVIEGMLEYNNNDITDQKLTTYATIDGNNCSFNPRDTDAGNSGSVSYDCILENVTENTQYIINIYGNGTNANYQGNFIAKDLFLSDEEIAGGTGVLKGTIFSGDTDNKLINLTGGNLNHALTNVFQKIGYSIVTDIDTTVDMYVKIINGETFTTETFSRDFEAGKVGFLIGHDVLEDIPIDPNYQLELWANCGNALATCEIVGGASEGYITDVRPTIENSFNIYVNDSWDGEVLLNFSAVNGATFSTTTGVLTYITTEEFVNFNLTSDNGNGYINKTFTNYNVSNDLYTTMDQTQTQVKISGKYSGQNIDKFTLVTEQGSFSTTNGTVSITPKYGNYSWNITDANIYDLFDVDFEIRQQYETITVQNVTDAVARFVDATTLIPFNNSDVTLTYPNYGSYSLTTDENGYIYFSGERNSTHSYYNITFEGTSGYVSPINYEVSNLISALPSNITYSISRANFTINIYDRVTGNLLTNFASVTMQGLFSGNTSTGVFGFEDVTISRGNYTLVVSSEGYGTEEKVVEYTSQDYLNVSVYLLNDTLANTGTVKIRTIDGVKRLIAGAKVTMEEYDDVSKSYSEVSECITNSNGECKFLVEVNTKSYIFKATYEQEGRTLFVVTDSEIFKNDISGGEPIIFSEVERTITLSFVDLFTPSPIYFLEYNPTESFNNITNVSRITVDFSTTDGHTTKVCVDYYKIIGGVRESLTNGLYCSEGASGTVTPSIAFVLNRSINYEAEIYLEENGAKTVLETYYYKSLASFSEVLKQGALADPFLLWLWVGLITLGFLFKNVPLIGYLGIPVAWVSFYIFPTLLIGSVSALKTIICIVLIYNARRKEDFE